MRGHALIAMGRNQCKLIFGIFNRFSDGPDLYPGELKSAIFGWNELVYATQKLVATVPALRASKLPAMKLSASNTKGWR